MKKTKLHRLCALALGALLLLSLFPFTSALADVDDTIHIKTEEDLQSLARSCTLDSYSRGKKVVLYFYPKDNTPGCTRQVGVFSVAYVEFEKLNANACI